MSVHGVRDQVSENVCHFNFPFWRRRGSDSIHSLSSAFAGSMASAPSQKKRQFVVRMVAHGGASDGLRQSRRHGELRVDVEQQIVSFAYPRHGRAIFKRTFPQPFVCVAGNSVLRVRCSMGRRSFM